jgi:hypothetical protein
MRKLFHASFGIRKILVKLDMTVNIELVTVWHAGMPEWVIPVGMRNWK